NGSYFINRPAGQSAVLICPAGQTTDCASVMTGSYNDAYGNPVQAFLFSHFAYGSTGYSYWDLYTWDNNAYWGTPNVPVYRNLAVGPNGVEGIGLSQPPRPLEPTPVYPSGTNVGNSYTVRWKSGRDIDRQPYPITYSIYYKYWAFGSTEPSNWTLSRAGMPCHDSGSGVPDSNNECSTFIPGPQPAGNWKWYVTAKLDGSMYYFYDTFLTTQSSPQSFTQPNP
ncbi:MAG TPA: hypothetical protein VF911_02700, partial [Thermoanaerobaculia bacterium]